VINEHPSGVIRTPKYERVGREIESLSTRKLITEN
jgi:hypothetical protein